MSPSFARSARLAALAAGTALLAACGAGENQAAQAPTDSSLPGPAVGSYKDAADSALRAGNAQLDSLRQAGVTPADGIDTAAARGTAASANDLRGTDTNRLLLQDTSRTPRRP